MTRECSQETGWKIAQAQIALAAKRTPEERSAMAKRGWATRRKSLALRQTTRPCPHCGGTGSVPKGAS